MRSNMKLIKKTKRGKMVGATQFNPQEFVDYLDGGSDQIAKTLKRRIDYLIGELRLDETSRDQSITYTQRVISNYLTIGADRGSAVIIKQNRFASQSAIKVMRSHDITDWSKHLTNEHPIPLSWFWRKLGECAEDCTDRDLYQFFALTRMVTVTKDEDRLMDQNGYRQRGSINERYEYVSTIHELERPPFEAYLAEDFESVETDKIIDFENLI